ncbi:MAG: hypothetical protein ACFCGT_26625 [Sandaracinaceae bacterium]
MEELLARVQRNRRAGPPPLARAGYAPAPPAPTGEVADLPGLPAAPSARPAPASKAPTPRERAGARQSAPAMPIAVPEPDLDDEPELVIEEAEEDDLEGVPLALPSMDSSPAVVRVVAGPEDRGPETFGQLLARALDLRPVR